MLEDVEKEELNAEAPPAEPDPVPQGDALELISSDEVLLQNKTEIDFEDVEVTGELVAPTDSLVSHAPGSVNLKPPPEPVPTDSQGQLEELVVTSTQLSVVVPNLGETLRYQHLLVPEGETVSIHIEAKAPRASLRSLKSSP